MFRLLNSGLKKVGVLQNTIIHNSYANIICDEDEDDKCIDTLSIENFSKIVEPKPYQSLRVFQINGFYDMLNSIMNPKMGQVYSNKSMLMKDNQILTLSDVCKLILKFNKEHDNSENSKESSQIAQTSDLSNTSLEGIKLSESVLQVKVHKYEDVEHVLNEKGCKAANMGNYKLALKYWKSAAYMNYAPAQFNLGVYYEHNDCDDKSAEMWYRRAVQSNYVDAAYNLAMVLNRKKSPELWESEIIELFELAAKHGSDDASKCLEYIRVQKMENNL